MNQLKKLGLFIIFINVMISCHGQSKPSTKPVGGPCEGCDQMYIGMPKEISSESTSIGWAEASQKLIVTGKIYKLDGKTPAPNVIVYYWHTDETGIYPSDSKTPAGLKHGKLRGWVKSDENGNYKIKTSRPAAYPRETIPQHIHLLIKEPGIDNAYYADLHFEDDPLYNTHKKKYGQNNRAGNELLKVVNDGKIQIAEHNIILGMNIPNYPS